MDGFWQGTALALIGAVLALVLGKRSENMAMLVMIAAVCMVSAMAISYLKPAMELIDKLRDIGKLDNEMLSALLKAVGIGLVTELATVICSDAGMGSVGKALQMLGAAVILWLALPLVEQLLELLQDVLGGA